MNRTKILAVLVALAATVAACSEMNPTSVNQQLLPEQPVTVDDGAIIGTSFPSFVELLRSSRPSTYYGS